MKILFCDIDSTINNHWVRIQKWAQPSFPGTSIHQNAFTREEIMKDLPIENAVESIEKFSKEYEIHFLSARNFPEAWDITKQWLDKWGFTYKSINIVRSSIDKVQFVKQNPCDLFIDDFSKGQEYGNSYEVLYTDTINQLNSMGINLEVFKNNWLELTEKYIED
jgi:uncharacterized HAD superfamily protein|tara:strand:+ start:277 stop:768 length:492 start_codon:yes stop_codon:yes gene_type:complete